jgi:hypothetical protein
MTRRLIIRSAAQRDIRQARRWYAAISRALGNDFVYAVDAALSLVIERPFAFPSVRRTFGGSCSIAFPMRFSMTPLTTESS